MNRKRFISGLLAAAVLMGAAACDRNAGRDLPTDTSDDIAGVEDTAATDGTIKVTLAETGSAETDADATDAVTVDIDIDVTTAGLPAPTPCAQQSGHCRSGPAGRSDWLRFDLAAVSQAGRCPAPAMPSRRDRIRSRPRRRRPWK